MRYLVRALAISVTIIVASVALPGPASASPDNQTLSWRNVDKDKCLGVAGGVMAPSQEIMVWTCNGAPDQTWVAIPLGNNYYLVQDSQGLNMCLSVANSSFANQTKLVLFPCKDSAHNQDQRWDLHGSIIPSLYVFTNFNSGLVAGLKNYAPFAGVQVVQEPYTTAWDQLWEPISR